MNPIKMSLLRICILSTSIIESYVWELMTKFAYGVQWQIALLALQFASHLIRERFPSLIGSKSLSNSLVVISLRIEILRTKAAFRNYTFQNKPTTFNNVFSMGKWLVTQLTNLSQFERRKRRRNNSLINSQFISLVFNPKISEEF